MEKNIKRFKILSILLLAFFVFSLISPENVLANEPSTSLQIQQETIIQGNMTRLIDFAPKTINGENGVYYLLKYTDGNYSELPYLSDYTFGVPNTSIPGIPGIRYVNSETETIYAHPGAIYGMGIEADIVIAVTLNESYKDLHLTGDAGKDNGHMRFYIYKGENNFNTPLWESWDSGHFDLTIPYSEGEKLYFAVDAGDDDYYDWSYWNDIHFNEESIMKITNPSNGHQYAIINDSIFWGDAKSYCENIGGHLATITSQEEQDFINQIMKGAPKDAYWLGATDEVTEGTWKWITDENFNYTFWDYGEPNNAWGGTEHYLGLYNTSQHMLVWNDFREDASLAGTMGFICEWEVVNTKATYCIKVVDELTNQGIGNSYVSFDGSTYITDSNGIINFSYPSNLVQDFKVSKLEYYEFSRNLYYLNNNCISEIKLSRRNNFSISADSFNFGNNFYDTLKGPEIDFGGKKFNLFEMPIATQIKIDDAVSVTYDDKEKTYKVMIGDMENESESTYQELKELVNSVGAKTSTNFYNKFRNIQSNLKKHKMNLGFEFNTYTCGYMLISNINGTPKLMEGGLVFVAEADGSITYPLPPAPAAYLKFGIKGEASGGFKLVLLETGSLNPEVAVNGQLGFTAAPYAGIGVGVKGIANAEARFEGQLDSTLKLPVMSLREDFKAEIQGTLYLTYDILMFINNEHTWNIGKPITIYPRGTQVNSVPQISIQPRDFILLPREYSRNTSLFISNNKSSDGRSTLGLNKSAIKTNVYPYGDPMLIPLLNNKQLLVWIDDDITRTAANRTSLMYSIFDGNYWSNPQYVNNDGTADFKPELAVTGNEVYLIWQNANKIFSDTVTLEEMKKSTEIYYAKFDGANFIDVTNLTAEPNAKHEMATAIAAYNNEISVIWVENSEDDVFGLSGVNSIFRKTQKDGNWEATQKVESGMPLITSLDTSYCNGTNVIAYSVDTDGDINTNTDSEVNIIEGIQKKQLTNDSVIDSSVKFAVGDNNADLYWNSDGQIKYALGGTYSDINILQNVTNIGIVDFQIMKNASGDKAIVWEQGDGFKQELYCLYFDKINTKWGNAIKLTDLNRKVNQSSGYIDSVGQIRMAFDSTEVLEINETNNEPYGKTDLMVIDFIKSYDLAIVSNIAYDDEMITPNNNISLWFKARNNSIEPINQMRVEILDTNNNVLNTYEISRTIASGAIEEIEIPYNLPNDLYNYNIKIKVTPIGVSDINLTDNVASTIIGYADIAIQNVTVEGESQLKEIHAIVKNIGYSDAQNIDIALHNNNLDGQIMQIKHIDVLPVGSSQDIVFQIDSNLLEFESENDRKELYISSTTQNDELLFGNNNNKVIVEPVRVKDISLNKTIISLTSNDTEQLVATIYPVDAINKGVVWLSNNEEVVSVDNNGVIHALGEGNARITVATIDGNKTASCDVIVGAPPASIIAETDILTPMAGAHNIITLSAKKSDGSIDTAFSGDKDLSISGYTAAPNGTIGYLNGSDLSTLANITDINFTDGIAKLDLILNCAASQNIKFTVAGIESNALTISPTFGAAYSLKIVTQPIGPYETGGGILSTQPAISVIDSFDNVVTNSTIQIIALKKAGSGDWDLSEEDLFINAVNGIAAFKNLRAINTTNKDINTAVISFTSDGIAGVDSSAFSIAAKNIVPPLPPLTVISTDPMANMSNVKIDSAISVLFNRTINGVVFTDEGISNEPGGKSRARARLISLKNIGGGLSIPIIYSIEDNKILITPTVPLNYDTTYELIIPPGSISDNNRRTLGESFSLKFTTEKNIITIASIKNISVRVTQGDGYILPSFVNAVLSDGSTKDVSVTWDALTTNISKPGIFTYSGTVSEYSGVVILKLTVVPKPNDDMIHPDIKYK